MMAVVFFNLLDTPNLYSPPLIFDYVFSPAQEIGQATPDSDEMKSSATGSEPRRRTPQATSKTTPPDSRLETPASTTFDKESDDHRFPISEPKLETETESAETSNELEPFEDIQLRYVPNEMAPAEAEGTHFVQSISPADVEVDLRNFDRPNNVSAKISLTADQKKMLEKKIKKWSEDLDPENWQDSTVEWEDDGRSYAARLRHSPAQSPTALDEAVIEISTEENGYSMHTEMRMQRLAFSNFAQFVDYWDPTVAVHNDELNGRFHANTTINVSSSRGVQPKFHGKVTTSSYDVRMGGPFPFQSQQSIFIGGLETGVKEIHLPKTNLPFLSDSTISANQWHLLSEETWLEFHGDGTYSWHGKSQREQKQLLPKTSFYIIGEKDAKLHIRGVLRGQVLIYTANRIVIDDDIIYSRHPELASNSDDFLGLVSEKDIEVAHPKITGPGDLHIHASIYAKGRFRVPNLYGNDEATLHICGSLTAGSISATEPRYATNITFDKRLESKRPPNFPMSDRYEVKDWDRVWKLKAPQK